MRLKKFALIWWINSSYKDVVPLSNFPVKQRAINSIATLTWVDNRTGLQTKAQAKILAISEDQNALDGTFVSEEGEILDQARKIFSKEAIDEKKSWDQKNKFKKNIIKSNKRQFQNLLKNESSIVPKCPVERNHRFSQPTVSTHSSDSIASTIRPNLHKQAASEVNLHNRNITSQQSYQYQNMIDPSNSENVQTQIQQDYFTPKISTPEQTIQGEAHQGSPIIPATAISKTVQSRSSGTKTISEKVLSLSSHDNLYYSSSEDEALTDENWSGAINAMAATIPGKVTKRDIMFQEMLLAAMKQQYKSAHPTEKSEEKFELPPQYLQPAPNMQEISPACGFYLPKNIIAYINTMIQTGVNFDEDDKWKIVVREVLLEVYGHTIANYTAKEKRGVRSAINPTLFKGLFQWACQVKPNLTKKEFILFINKFANNKRRYQESLSSKSSKKRKLNSGKEIMDKKKNEHDEEEEKEEVEELEESRTAIFQLPEKDEKFSAPTNDALNLPRNYYYLGLNSDQSHLQSGSTNASWIPHEDISQQFQMNPSRNSKRINWENCLTPL